MNRLNTDINPFPQAPTEGGYAAPLLPAHDGWYSGWWAGITVGFVVGLALAVLIGVLR